MAIKLKCFITPLLPVVSKQIDQYIYCNTVYIQMNISKN